MEGRQQSRMAETAGQSVTDFGEALARAALATIGEARQTLGNRDLAVPEAVHALRKALKRWRALLRLLEGPLGRQADRMRTEARALTRALAATRDAQSALDALDDLGKAQAPLSSTTIAALRRRLIALRETAQGRDVTPDLCERVARYLDGAVRWVERWPCQSIDFDTTVAGLTATYRRARKLLPEDWAEADAAQLHALRRRVVEHRDQMDLVAPLLPRYDGARSKQAQRLRRRLGACQDLAVLARLTAPRQALAPWRARLSPIIEARRAAHVKSAARIATRLFAQKPKAFRRRLGAGWSTRKARAGR